MKIDMSRGTVLVGPMSVGPVSVPSKALYNIGITLPFLLLLCSQATEPGRADHPHPDASLVRQLQRAVPV